MRRRWAFLPALALALALPASGGRAQAPSAMDGWTMTALGTLMPQMSVALGAVHGRATTCGLTAEAAAVAAKHDEHLSRLLRRMPQADAGALRHEFLAVAAALAHPEEACAEEQRQEIRGKLADLLGSVDDLHAAVGEEP